MLRSGKALRAATILAFCVVAAMPAAAGSRSSKDVECLAGCRGTAPEVVQRIGKPISTRPLALAGNPKLEEMATNVWCEREGRCVGMASSPPHRSWVTFTHAGISTWSW